MISRREEVIQAVKALMVVAAPAAEVARDAPWPKRPDPGGTIILHDGDPGEPEITLSPLRYTYNHELELEVLGPEGSDARHELLDALLIPIGLAVETNRTLGGLTEWLEISAAAPEDVVTENGQPVRATTLRITAVYTTNNPLS